MTWNIERTESFDKWWKREKIHDGNYPYHKRALEDFKNLSLPGDVQKCLFRNISFECWVIRLPDKLRQQGKSGGLRVIFVLDLEEKRLILQGTFRRANLGFKGSSGRYDNAYDDLIKALAVEFVESKL